MAARVVGDQCVRDLLMPQLITGERSALVAGPGFVNPDMNRDFRNLGLVDRRGSRSPIQRCQPTRIAVGENIYRATRIGTVQVSDNLQTVLAD